MTAQSRFPLAAVDIGNSRIKLGLFNAPAAGAALAVPSRWIHVETATWQPAEIAGALAPLKPSELSWRIASVHRAAAARLQQWLAAEQAVDVALLTARELPLKVDLKSPEKAGVDRLLGAVAANALRPPDRGAIVVSVGSAITVDLVSPQGHFCGGAILPGIRMSARALDEFTDLLPDLEVSSLDDAPPALGTNTREAIESGLFWGAVGAMRTLVEQLSQSLYAAPIVILTGGAAASVAPLLRGDVRYEPHLVLAGIALV